jgi:hypothetical protein
MKRSIHLPHLIINYSINRLINNGKFQYENKSITLDIESKTDNYEDIHQEAVTAICLTEKVNPKQIKITGIMTF